MRSHLRCLIVIGFLIGYCKICLADRPNFVLVMCDDMGWSDVGFNGGKHIRTPHLDQMAASGLNLTRFYAQAPVCSPTRASIVTGRHHDRMGVYNANSGHLRDGEFTLYEALAKHGYATGHFGKWHLGTLTRKVRDSNRGGPKTQDYSPPWQHQVHTTFATEAKTPTYDPMWRPSKPSRGDSFTGFSSKGWNALTENTPKTLYGTRYWTSEETMVDPESTELRGDDSEIITDRALKFIEQHRERPFLAIIWFHAPHLPVVASPQDAQSYENGSTSAYERNYYGCVTALDRQMGRIRAALRDWEIADNTMLTFCSDNGPEGNDRAPGKAGPFRGRKRVLYEGGVRVPSLIEWPAKVKAGSVSSVASCTVDYFPTIREIVGFDMPDDRPLDGISLIPVMTGTVSARPQPLAFHIRGKAAWHDGKWKAIRPASNASWELYDLEIDPSESNNIAAEHSQKLQSMIKAWKQWKTSVEASDSGSDY